MSGPKTISYSINALLAAVAEELRRKHAAEEAHRREEMARQRREALRASKQEARTGLRTLEDLKRRLTVLRERFPKEAVDVAIPEIGGAPQEDDHAQWQRFASQLGVVIRSVQQQLQSECERVEANEGFRNAMVGIVSESKVRPRTIAEVLAMAAGNPATAPDEVDGRNAGKRQRVVAELADRFATIDLDDVPSEVRGLLEELAVTPSDQRADAIRIDLTIRLQLAMEEQSKRQVNQAIAKELLAQLPLPGQFEVDVMRERLLLVIEGEADLDASLRADAAVLIAEANRREELTREEIATRVLEQSLADLGYDVAPISKTLFAEGGTLHFHQPDWADYYVRMRISPSTKEVKLHMVRVGMEDSSEGRRAEDERMEQAWCADGFPSLLAKLKAGGVDTRLERKLMPGALPVMPVPADSIAAELRERVERRSQGTEGPVSMAPRRMEQRWP